MEALRSSRRPAKSSYGDVFGGPPKYSAPFAAKSDDYGEIFGGIADSCSIPFLDLPPAAESYDGGGRIDYSEIFGGFKGGDFAVDYEELFNEKRKTAESSASSNGRVRMDATFGHHAEVSDLLPEGASKNYGVSSEKSKFLSTSNLSDDRSKQFNRLYRMTSSGSIEDVISGKTHITELHAVPGYTDMINSCSSQDIRSNNSPNIQTNELANNVSYNGQLNDLEQEKIAPSTSSTDNTKISGGDLRSNLKEYNTRHAASDDDTVNVKHHSRSSSNYSASSGDIPYPDSTYVSISDINLRTRPSKLPPPSRAPPKLANKQENTKSRQIHYSIGASRSHGLHGVAKDSSSRFLDVEVDASSAAAASAAAMKEAMEQAEARLKSAKELMERKRDMQDIRKKLGHKEGAKYDEMKEATASEVEIFSSEVRTKKLLPKEGKGMTEYALDGMHKARKVGKVSPDHGKQETYVVTTEESHQMRQGNGFKSSWMYNKSEDVSGEWKTEDQFYELINNEKRFRAVKEASKQEDVEKKSKTTAKVNEEKEICSEKAELANEFKRTLKLNKVDATIERDEIVDNPKACIMTIKEEIWKIPEEIPETCILSKTEDYSSSYHHQNANKKLQASQEALMGGEELQKPDALVEASCGENEVYLESSNNSFRFEEIYHDDKVDWKLQPAKEVCEHGDEEEELSGTYMTSASHESEENMKMFRRTGVQHEIEIEMEVTSGTCVREAEEELVAHEEAYLYENSDYTSGNGQQESCNEENECKLEDSSSVGKSNGVQGPHIPAENDLQTEVDHDGNEVRENFEEVKPALSTIGLGVIERKMNSAKETSWPDYGGAETREAQPELQQNEKKQNANQTPPVVENTVEPGVLGGDHAEREHGKFKEGNGVIGLEKAHPHCDAAQEDFQRAADKDIGDVQGSSVQNEELGDAAEEVCRKPRSSSDGAIETLGTVTSENSESGAHKREKMDEKTIEREAAYEKEQARKLEEEKEREREREKDRLAVERATREAHERAIAESRGRAERIAVERVTAEARQRALAESWEKAEKASAEALEKSLAEKALKEAKLRAERAAVERATAEARERAVEKALADRAAADARQRAERLNTMSRDKNRKENEAGDSFRTSDKEDREIKLKSSSFDVLHDIRFKSTGSSGSFQRVSSAHGEVDSPLRCKARLERHQRTVERAAKALAEKNMRDILAQREQAERNRLAEALDADVKRWSTGKEGNLRALLSTLQYILGPESGWQPIPLTDVITAAAVKKAYRKATLCVHPDKLQQRGASIQQKYICEKVFDLLKDAWNRFNSEER